ncbi:MAG: haloacid dehalogenase [Acidilobaceae archaeon]|nr:haloacid dehalogenase [Acidilobaceae archaeon]
MEKAFASIEQYLRERDAVREEAIKVTRDIVRASKAVVSLVFRKELEEAERKAGELELLARQLAERLRGYPDLLYSGLVYNGLSEYVEAALLLDAARGRELRGHEELGVPPVPYLQGLGDLVGELRRLALEKVKAGEIAEAWRLIGVMEAIYFNLSRLEYPESLIPGVKHKADVARRLLDETIALVVHVESLARSRQ